MRLLFIFLLATSSIFATGQAKKDTNVHFNPQVNQAPDTVGLLQAVDLRELNDKLLIDLPYRYYVPLTQWLNARLQLRATEYLRRHQVAAPGTRAQ